MAAVVPSDEELRKAEDKRLYARMKRESSKLSAAHLAVFVATKDHKRKQKLKELFVTHGHELDISMDILITEEKIDLESVMRKWTPMTSRELETKFGSESAKSLMELKRRKKEYEVMPEAPEDENLWMWRVADLSSFSIKKQLIKQGLQTAAFLDVSL